MLDPGPDTLPLPLGVAHVPSPRKYVVLDGVPVTAPASAVDELIIVPLVGSVTEVVFVAVKVVEYAPEVVSAPPRLTALPPMLPTEVVSDPAVFVMSPVCAGSMLAGNVVP